MDDQSDDDQALVMSVTLHLLVIGRPFRLRALRRAVEHILEFRAQLWLTQPGAIARHLIDLPPPGAFLSILRES
jgi:hypothetical protein